ncbi:hypothetical protein FORC065_0578 [Yersinia enterocolitica]|nr:hypothetical protein FORC065_0578 [Yersinia enterocolitica]
MYKSVLYCLFLEKIKTIGVIVAARLSAASAQGAGAYT